MSTSLFTSCLTERWRITLGVGAVLLFLIALTWQYDVPEFDASEDSSASRYLQGLTGKLSNALPDWTSSKSNGEESTGEDEYHQEETAPLKDFAVSTTVIRPLSEAKPSDSGVSPTVQQNTDSHSGNESKVYPGCPKPDINEDVAICIVARNQSEDLKEWFRHHYHHLGIRRFYVMDNRTITPLSDTPDYTIPKKHITFVYNPEEEPYPSNRQWHSYTQRQTRFGHLHKWIGYIDADEFLEIKDRPGVSMAAFLSRYEDDLLPSNLANPNISNAGAFAINWQVHNSKNHLYRQPSTRAAYTSCIWDGSDPNGEDSHNMYVKSFVRTAYFDGLATVHNSNLNSSKVTVGEYGDIVDSHLRTPITRDRIVLHHYMIKSKEDFVDKLMRGDVQDNPRTWGWWDKYEQSLRADCPGLANYYP